MNTFWVVVTVLVIIVLIVAIRYGWIGAIIEGFGNAIDDIDFGGSD